MMKGKDEGPAGPFGFMRGMPGPGRGPHAGAARAPELEGLFEEWLAQVEAEALRVVEAQQEVSAGQVAESLGLSREGALTVLTRLVRRRRIGAVYRKNQGSKEEK